MVPQGAITWSLLARFTTKNLLAAHPDLLEEDRKGLGRKLKKVTRKREILEAIDCFTGKRWPQEGV